MIYLTHLHLHKQLNNHSETIVQIPWGCIALINVLLNVVQTFTANINTNKSQAQTNHTQEQITEEFQEQNKQFLLLFGFIRQCDRVNGHTSPHTLKAYRHTE